MYCSLSFIKHDREAFSDVATTSSSSVLKVAGWLINLKLRQVDLIQLQVAKVSS